MKTGIITQYLAFDKDVFISSHSLSLILLPIHQTKPMPSPAKNKTCNMVRKRFRIIVEARKLSQSLFPSFGNTITGLNDFASSKGIEA